MAATKKTADGDPGYWQIYGRLCTDLPEALYSIGSLGTIMLRYSGNYLADFAAGELDPEKAGFRLDPAEPVPYRLRLEGFTLTAVPNHETLAFQAWRLADFIAAMEDLCGRMPDMQQIIDDAFPPDRRKENKIGDTA